MLALLHKSLDWLLQWVLIALMIALTAIVMYAVIMRKLGSAPVWYDEIASVLLAWVTYYGAALAALRRRHIGFDGLLLALPLGLRKAAVVVSEACVIAFFVMLAWMGLRVLDVLHDDTLVSITWVPIWLTQSVIPISAILFIVGELLSLPMYWRSVVAGKSLDHPDYEVERA